ncbi:MAG: type II toxin-antitoxin system VapC family toxin [Spirochaetaceae bacterium]|nr:type II toxin-antitoxin system VapC family toxin [Spirochaetaceae bacterium]
MKIILDTHIFLWALSDPGKIDPVKKVEIQTLANTIFISSISIAEIMIKSSLNKLGISFDPVEMVEKSGFEFLDFNAEDAVLLKELPFHHKDPFDRMLIAQSIANKFHIMSDDRKFRLYDCKLL